MLTRTHITTLLVLAIAVWASALLALGLPFTWQYMAPFTLAVTVLSTACVAFERWCWRWQLFRGWLVKQPDIQGTWRAVLRPVAGTPQVDGIMVVRQTFSTVSARLFTKESSSSLVAHSWVPESDGLFQLAAVYQNTPDVSLRGLRSEIHYGGFLLDVRGDPPSSIAGHYWTDRASKGTIDLSDRNPELLSSYGEGARRFRLPT